MWGPAARSAARSWAVCMASHARAVPTPASSRRTARLGLIRACPCSTRLRHVLALFLRVDDDVCQHGFKSV